MNKNIIHNLYTLVVTLIGLSFTACGCSKDKNSQEKTPITPQKPIQTFHNRPTSFDNDDMFLDFIQKAHFNYMWEGAESNSGLARERIHIDGNYPLNDQDIITTGGSGFGIAGLLVAIERGFIDRTEAVARFEKIITFLEKADRYHGMWSHWIDGKTGKTKPFGQKDNGGDIVESAFLIQGLLCARQYFQNGDTKEKEIATRIDNLWKEMEWDWYLNGQDVLYWHWSPQYEWQMNFPLEGYNECFIAYILGASSPTHPIPASAYHKGWARNGAIKSSQVTYGLPLVLKHNGAERYGGPLFWAHYSFIGLNPKGLTDQYADYWVLNKNHTLINYKYCVENPKGYKGYGSNSWGLTASYSVKGYAAHSPTNDFGVIVPTASLSSFPYTPNESITALKHFYYDLGDIIWGKYGFYDAFSEQYIWYPQRYLAIDQLTIAPMIENHRTGLLWRLFMSCPEVQNGLKKLNFYTNSL
ncbi:glucoamylase family protein [Capnocytophaga catalasegens]|uniref:Glycoamylase-like domain-containing protein n=1 Tax=Capnocytophaga catalasegens TaxID=1004260 RepID=A0AAV5AY67_9FLAO|nr:glucoamylase family protein [Capnocytophaga catalasegens]GIZ15904.1 hypothetical protein RCZ03_19040 [Capnocytophaga catalasegens]GJM49968.1 hypothetical protein RCZ15_09430 [Capnocytophaga catalasegens]GJM54140.1 hypothetical protein RCZ16_24560 [Capnocytophaga catalasegens]